MTAVLPALVEGGSADNLGFPRIFGVEMELLDATFPGFHYPGIHTGGFGPAMQRTEDQVAKLSVDELRTIIKDAGIVGLGGAAFPTHVKLCPPEDKPVDAVFLNGAECEPFLTCDHCLMLEKAEQVLSGFELVRRATFSVVSIHSTTGFGTADFAAWPIVCQVLLLGLMFVGGMGGSTGGGFKMIRGAVVVQHVLGEIRKVLHPRGVIITRVGGRAIRDDLVFKVLAFLAMYMATHAIGTFVLAAMGSDLVTAMSASLAALSSRRCG